MDMTREQLFPLSLSEKWRKKHVSKRGPSDPGISCFREGVSIPLSTQLGNLAHTSPFNFKLYHPIHIQFLFSTFSFVWFVFSCNKQQKTTTLIMITIKAITSILMMTITGITTITITMMAISISITMMTMTRKRQLWGVLRRRKWSLQHHCRKWVSNVKLYWVISYYHCGK